MTLALFFFSKALGTLRGTDYVGHLLILLLPLPRTAQAVKSEEAEGEDAAAEDEEAVDHAAHQEVDPEEQRGVLGGALLHLADLPQDLQEEGRGTLCSNCVLKLKVCQVASSRSWHFHGHLVVVSEEGAEELHL